MTSRRGVVDFSAFRTGRSGWSDELEDGLFAAALPPVGGLTCSGFAGYNDRPAKNFEGSIPYGIKPSPASRAGS